MSTATDKIAARIAALPEEDRAAVSEDVLDYVDELLAVRAKIREAEADLSAGRVAPADTVFARLIAKHGATS